MDASAPPSRLTLCGPACVSFIVRPELCFEFFCVSLRRKIQVVRLEGRWIEDSSGDTRLAPDPEEPDELAFEVGRDRVEDLREDV